MFVSFSIQGAYFWCFGIIGLQDVGSIYAEIVNIRTSVNVSSDSGSQIGSLFGYEYARNCSVQNTSVVGGNINSKNLNTTWVGGFIGLQDNNLTIINSSLQLTNITGYTYVGGFVGYCFQSLYLINSKIQQVRLSGSSVGIVTSSGSVYLTNSSSTQIFVNGVLKSDCAVLSNANGC
ncbi:Hypothetical_protein [Hexamita inflata]|uniref:Hypothetical_protein n=1 Tax=Hexamita inflata TaxID=28002 RepID=A0AA86QDS3_9EUKA|nr:Hypothetical protein HINF_LOCUS45064 [Hexamita inflata]